MNPGVTFLDWKISSGWLESWDGLMFRQPMKTLKMASAQVVKISVTNNSPSQDSNHPDDLFQSTCILLLKKVNCVKNLILLNLGKQRCQKWWRWGWWRGLWGIWRRWWWRRSGTQTKIWKNWKCYEHNFKWRRMCQLHGCTHQGACLGFSFGGQSLWSRTL